jgi:hypothetical protein
MSRANPVNATFVAINASSSASVGCRGRSNYNHRILNICILVKTYVHYKNSKDGRVKAREANDKEDENAAESI